MIDRNPEKTARNETARLEAFSDGVFAIAITLLIIEIKVPQVDAQHSLTHALLDLWPSYFAYAISFVVIGIMWANHHAMFRDIIRCDHTLIVCNLFLLLSVSFLPFPTALLAEYLRDGTHQDVATAAYGASMTVNAIAFGLLWFYPVLRGGFIDPSVSAARIRTRSLRFLSGTPLYAMTVILAFVKYELSIAMLAALAFLYLLPTPE